MYDDDKSWTWGCGVIFLFTLPLWYGLFLLLLGFTMYVLVGAAVIWVLWTVYKYIKKVLDDNGISFKKETSNKTKRNVIVNQLDNGRSEEWTWQRSEELGVTVHTRTILNEKKHPICVVNYIPGSTSKTYKISSLTYSRGNGTLFESYLEDLAVFTPKKIEKLFEIKEQNSEKLDKMRRQWQSQLDEIIELVSHISQLKAPRHITYWFDDFSCDNYTAIRSLKNANKIGKNYKNDNSDYYPKSLSGIFAINDLMKKHNDQLIKLEKHLSYKDPNGTYRFFLDFILEEEYIYELDKIALDTIKADWVGEAGENAVRQQLLKMDGGSQSKLLTDVIMPFNYGNQDSTTQIDGIYLSRHGIFNIEVKTRTNLKSVKLSSGGNLVINGNDSESNSSNSLLEQVSIHHSAIRVLFENSNNKVIQKFLEKNHGKLPIVNVVVMIDKNHRSDFTIDTDSFEKNNIKATNLNGLYQSVISGDYGGYIDNKTLNEMLKILKDNASYTVNDSNNHVYRNGNLTGKSYSHMIFFHDRFKEYSIPNDQILKDIERYVVFKTEKLKELNEKVDVLTKQLKYSYFYGMEILDGTAFEKQDEAFKKLQPYFDYVLAEHSLDEPVSAIPEAIYDMEYYYKHLVLNDHDVFTYSI